MTHEHWLILLVVTQVADVITTNYGVRHSIVSEGNKVMRKLIARFGLLGALVGAKAAIFGAMYYAGWLATAEIVRPLAVMGLVGLVWNARKILAEREELRS